MVCLLNAATDNDIISSFPGWTRPVWVGGLVQARLCSTLTLKGCCVFWCLRPDYSRTSFDSDRRRRAPAHRPFGDCDSRSAPAHFHVFDRAFVKECQTEQLRLQKRLPSAPGAGSRPPQDALKWISLLSFNEITKNQEAGPPGIFRCLNLEFPERMWGNNCRFYTQAAKRMNYLELDFKLKTTFCFPALA